MESYQHNQVKQCIGSALSELGRRRNLGLYFMDGFRVHMPLSHVEYEPDGCFVRYRSLKPAQGSKSPKAVFRHGRKQTFIGLNGVPDVVVEIASPSRLEADYDTKLHEYARLKVPEFWLLMPKGPSYQLTILTLAKQPFGYVPTHRPHEVWVWSPTFALQFRLLCLPSPEQGLCVYQLRSRRVGGQGR